MEIEVKKLSPQWIECPKLIQSEFGMIVFATALTGNGYEGVVLQSPKGSSGGPLYKIGAFVEELSASTFTDFEGGQVTFKMGLPELQMQSVEAKAMTGEGILNRIRSFIFG